MLGSQGVIFALTAAASTILIACPDAHVSEMPSAITVGVGRGARIGVPFENATAPEVAAGVGAVVFGETGRLTLSALVPLTGTSDDERLAAPRRSGQPAPDGPDVGTARRPA